MDLMDGSATTLSRRIATRQLAPSDVMAAYLARLDKINPAINARAPRFLTVFVATAQQVPPEAPQRPSADRSFLGFDDMLPNSLRGPSVQGRFWRCAA